MKKFIRKNWIVLTAVLVAVVLITIMSIVRKQEVKYKLSPTEVLTALADTGKLVTPFEVFNSTGKAAKPAVIVDIRNSDDFSKGHIENALNIPVPGIFGKRALKLFGELADAGQPVILYGNDQLQANGPWMLLMQAGYSNVKVMQGGYDFFKMLPVSDSLMKAQKLCYKAEMPALDTAEFKKKEAQATTTNKPLEAPKVKKVVPVKKAESSGGGC